MIVIKKKTIQPMGPNPTQPNPCGLGWIKKTLQPVPCTPLSPTSPGQFALFDIIYETDCCIIKLQIANYSVPQLTIRLQSDL